MILKDLEKLTEHKRNRGETIMGLTNMIFYHFFPLPSSAFSQVESINLVFHFHGISVKIFHFHGINVKFLLE